MTSRRMTLMTLVLVWCAASRTAGSEEVDQDPEAASDLQPNYDVTYDFEPADSSSVEKRERTYGFGLGKRDRPYRSYGFGLGKRARVYGFGLGKRDRSYRSYGFGLGKRDRTYGFGLGKRQPSYSFGLGKRASSQYAFGLGKRSAYDAAPEKRQTYGFGLGKRSWGWFEGPTRDVLKRPSYGFGLGKRSAPVGDKDQSLEDEDAALILLTAAEEMADEERSPAGHRHTMSTHGKPHEKQATEDESPRSVGKAALGVRYQL